MLAEVGRDVADAEPAGRVVRRRDRRRVRRRPGVPVGPGPVLGEHLLGRQPGRVVQQQQQVAVDRGGPGADFQRVPEAADRFFRPALLAEVSPEVAPAVGQVGLVLHGPLVVGLGVVLAAEGFQGQAEGVVRLGVVGLPLDGLGQRGVGLLGLAGVGQSQAEVVQAAGVVRPKFDRSAELGHGVGQVPGPHQGVAEAEAGVRALRFESGDFAERRDGGREVVHRRPTQADVEPRGRVVRVPGQAVLVLGRGLGQAAGPAVQVAEVEVRVRVAGYGGEGVDVTRGRVVRLARVDHQHAEVAPARGVGRVGGDEFAVQPRGRGRVPGLVLGHGRSEPSVGVGHTVLHDMLPRGLP